jgi:hypothetical protein
MKKCYNSKKFSQQVNELFKTLEKTAFKDLITLRDLHDALFHMTAWVNKPLKEIGDEEFLEAFKSRILSTKTFDFYVPIYYLYDFPKNMKLGGSMILDFQDLPTDVQSYFIMRWEHGFSIYTEYHRTKEDYTDLKKGSVFIHFVVEANGPDKANQKGRDLAEEVFHIVRFLYVINFNIVDMRYEVRDRKMAGGMEGIAGLPFIGGASYVKRFEERFTILTDIFTRANLNEVERKIRNAVRIFGIQTAITNNQVRFVLLVTCLETLLMTESDREYTLWKLGEKSAFILGRNKRRINNYIKEAYGKRSAFVHGRIKEALVTENDIFEAQGLVINLVWKLVFDFLRNGYTSIQKRKGSKSIDEYIEETKFGNA